MIALLQMEVMGGASAGAASGGQLLARGDLGDWGQLIVVALVFVASGVNGLIQAAKKKREAKERERQTPMSKPSPTSPAVKPARARTVQRQTEQTQQPIPLGPKPQARRRPDPPRPRPSTVSQSPPTANVPPIFESLAEAIREANKDKSQRSSKGKRRVPAREPARPVASAKPPKKKAHQAVSDRRFIQKHEQEHDASMEKRLGSLAEGVVKPLAVNPYAKKTVGAAVLHGVDLRQAIILKEILGPPVAMRDTDDYFNP